MEIKRRPLLTVYEIRRIADTPTSRDIHVAQLGGDFARLVASTEYTQITPGGPVKRPIEVDLYAIGVDGHFTEDRGIEALIRFQDTARPFSLRYSIKETPKGIIHTLLEFSGREVRRSFGGFVGANLLYRETRESPGGSITRNDITNAHDNRHALVLSESTAVGLLERVHLL